MSELHTKIGRLLQLERERRGLALADLSSELKISEENLTSIEAGEIDSLPSELYYNLFAKSYSEYLGIDFNATMEAIKEDIGETRPAAGQKEGAEGVKADGETESDDETGEKSEHGPGRKLMIIAGAVVVAFILFIVGYKLLIHDHAAGGGHNAIGSDGTSENEGATEQLQAQYANYDWSAATSQPPDSLKLTLTAREESWATVLADGDTILYQNLTPWREYTVPAKYRLLVSVGVPRVVDVQLNGQKAYLASAESGRISRVEITQVNRDLFYEPPTPKATRQPAALNSSETTDEESDNNTQNSADEKPSQSQGADRAKQSTADNRTPARESTQGPTQNPTLNRPSNSTQDTAVKSVKPQPVKPDTVSGGARPSTADHSPDHRNARPYEGTRVQTTSGQTLAKDSL